MITVALSRQDLSVGAVDCIGDFSHVDATIKFKFYLQVVFAFNFDFLDGLKHLDSLQLSWQTATFLAVCYLMNRLWFLLYDPVQCSAVINVYILSICVFFSVIFKY